MRLFFALWPSLEKAEEIAVWARNAHALFGGRMMQTDTLHMTLAFLGVADAQQRSVLVDACQHWQLPSGDMALHEPGRFGHAKVVWVGPGANEGDALTWLYQANELLWQRLTPFGWRPQEPVFRPHVSLLRNAGAGDVAALQGPTVTWTPERCVLVASQPTDTRSRYTVLADIPLSR